MIFHPSRPVSSPQDHSAARRHATLPPWLRAQLRSALLQGPAGFDAIQDEEALVRRALDRLTALDPELGELVSRRIYSTPSAILPVDPRTWQRAKVLFHRYLKLELQAAPSSWPC